MKTLIRLLVGAAMVAGLVPVFASAASGHDTTGTTISCASVSGTFTDFQASEHPIVWHVEVTGDPFQTVATVESPSGFVGTGTASADITALTDPLNGSPGTVTAFATWPGGQSATTSEQVTCGTAPATLATPATPTVPVQVGGISATAPAATPGATAATPVTAAASFTG